MSDSPTSIVWLRRDLRLHDHAVWHRALQSAAKLQPVFIFDTEILERFSNKQDKRLSFIAAILCRMHAQLTEQGGGLLVLHGKAQEIMPGLAAAIEAQVIFSGEDMEPATRARDEAVKEAVEPACGFVQELDHLMQHPKKVVKDDGSPYRVYTPYSKQWRNLVDDATYAERKVDLKGRLADFAHSIKQAQGAGLKVVTMDSEAAMLKAVGYEKVELGEWQADGGQKQMQHFIGSQVNQYSKTRDYMDREGTSRLSPYLRFGTISIRECARLAIEQQQSEKWMNELIWREFYAMILFHYPEVVEKEFNPVYRDKLPWNRDEKIFQRFCDGMTGYPVIDAAMRELKETGWMHNRARMIVASFLTKDLLIDWRLGEEHFAQYLMDYELASNNGGWQWAASTGTDAQPYFRIFNPYLQSKKFDPEGEYIRRWVPELREVKGADIHEPKPSLFEPLDYPAPIVDHYEMRDKALAMFKKLSDAA